METKKIPFKEVGLGDIIRLFDGAYGDATVREMDLNDETPWVRVFRPYVSTSDFTHTGGVIPYIGIEEFKIFSGTVELVRRANPVPK